MDDIQQIVDSEISRRGLKNVDELIMQLEAELEPEATHGHKPGA